MIKWLLSKLRVHDIVKNIDNQDLLYLRRYFILRTKWFKIFLHNIVLPDMDNDPHDHPWAFLGIVLKGGYTEQRWNRKRELVKTQERNAPAIGFRGLDSVHKITEVKPNTWTLIICGPRKQDWGFVTKKGWVFWREYLGYWGDEEID